MSRSFRDSALAIGVVSIPAAIPLAGYIDHNKLVILPEQALRVLAWWLIFSFVGSLIVLAVGRLSASSRNRLALLLGGLLCLLPVIKTAGLLGLAKWLAIAALAGLAIWLGKYPKALQATLAGTSVALLFPLANLVTHTWGSSNEGVISPKTVLPVASEEAKRPNVYFFILDEYAGRESLKYLLDIDIGPFVNELESKGFFMPRRAVANYPMTFLAVSSMMEMDYLANENSPPFKDRTVFNQVLSSENATLKTFKALGYRLAKLSSSFWGATGCHNIPGERCFNPSKHFWFTQTEYNLLKIFPFKVKLFEKLNPYVSTLDDARLHVDELLQTPGPLFYYGHTMPPHQPRVFDTRCQKLESWQDAEPVEENEYALQIRCVNKTIERFVDHIIQVDPGALIILTADHGHDKHVDWKSSLNNWDKKALQTRFNIFMAIRAPKSCQKYLYDGMSPVNLMRFASACVVGSKPSYIKNRSFISVYEENPDYGHVREISVPSVFP
jgi:hypothetical protein